ncbi:MAG: hypothetical protein GWP14_07175 [Actinobacteria bacterium]|nr:hypothetical protein [Actinomycetota bacterium]
MAQEEQVLVISRDILAEVGLFQGLMFDTDRYLDKIFAPGVPRFIPRSSAESDPSYKQIIPYVIITHAGKCLCYVRGKRAGETRLVGQMSIGIGGHINPGDDGFPLLGFREAYDSAVEREVEEEIHVRANHNDRIVALLNDDSNSVGSVHLGVVHYWTLDSFDVDKKEQMITRMSFADIQELQTNRESMETWSQLCLDRLDEMAKHAYSN